jgi:hypothetical protein
VVSEFISALSWPPASFPVWASIFLLFMLSVLALVVKWKCLFCRSSWNWQNKIPCGQTIQDMGGHPSGLIHCPPRSGSEGSLGRGSCWGLIAQCKYQSEASGMLVSRAYLRGLSGFITSLGQGSPRMCSWFTQADCTEQQRWFFIFISLLSMVVLP